MNTLKYSRTNKGFTLIEMTIVLVIIGLIVTAVTAGINLQRTAEINKIKKTFIDQWAQIYNEYYTRTGSVLGDNQIEPRYMVGGYEVRYARNGGSGIQGMRNSSLSGGTIGNGIPGRVCEGQGQHITPDDRPIIKDISLFYLMDKHGIKMPAGRAEGREDRYSYLDTNGNNQEIQICFQWNPPGFSEGSGNMMVIRGLTPSMARELDVMVDGKPDAIEGLFREQNPRKNTLDTQGIAGREWGTNDTYEFSEQAKLDISNNTTPKKDDIGKNRDENRVINVTAIYKMNQ